MWVTRDEDADGPLCEALRAAGRVPCLEPVLETVSSPAAAQLGEDLARLAPGDWVALTSVRAVERLPHARGDVNVAVVGPRTRAAAEARGWAVALESPEGTGASLWPALASRARGHRVLYPRSERASVPTMLGVELWAPAVYGQRARDFDAAIAARVDAAAIASPSAALVAAAVIRAHELPVWSIGPTTTEALRELGVARITEAREATFAALARIGT